MDEASKSTFKLSLFNWGPGFCGFCYNGREGHPNDDPPWMACPDDWTETVSTYNLHAGLERLVRVPRQNGTFSHSRPRLSPDGTKLTLSAWKPDGDDFYTDGRLYILDRTARELLGHASVETTQIYTHVSNKGGGGVKSPLDEG